MLEFIESDEGQLGKAECLKLVTIEDGIVSDAAGRPGLDPYFMVNVVFASESEYVVDNVPTGHSAMPVAVTSDEIVVTDGEKFYGARHSGIEKLHELKIPSDSNLYILEENDLPERLKALTTSDRDCILREIQRFCS